MRVMVQSHDDVEYADDGERAYQAALARARRAAMAVSLAQSELVSDLAELRAGIEQARRGRLPASAHQP